jgi:hypothetical protein
MKVPGKGIKRYVDMNLESTSSVAGWIVLFGFTACLSAVYGFSRRTRSWIRPSLLLLGLVWFFMAAVQGIPLYVAPMGFTLTVVFYMAIGLAHNYD